MSRAPISLVQWRLERGLGCRNWSRMSLQNHRQVRAVVQIDRGLLLSAADCPSWNKMSLANRQVLVLARTDLALLLRAEAYLNSSRM